MPATDQFWRNLKTLHVVFALSALTLLIAIVMMLGFDHSDEYRDYQRTYFEIRALQLEQNEQAIASPENAARLEELQQQWETAQRELDDHQGELADLRNREGNLDLRVDVLTRELRDRKAAQKLIVADRDLVIAEGATEDELSALDARYTAEGERVTRARRDLESAETELAAVQEELAEWTADRDRIEADIAKATEELARLRKTRDQLAPESLGKRIKRSVMEWPIVDGFNSHIKPHQDWLPELPIKLGMAETARFDRCRTCHMGIDQVESDGLPALPHGLIESDQPEDWVAANAFPHPYATHPNAELYCTANSPHPVSEFGCTICHEGVGSATSFTNAQHMPWNPHIGEEWDEKYDFEVNHHWEYPMLTDRFIESSCIKCHHDVTSLAHHPEWGATAPKVNEGFELVKEYGCYGCHEIHGYENGERIGPDLRLEPPTRAEALRAAKRQIGLLPEQKPTAEQREAMADLLPKLLETDNPHPGTLRKTGPALTHIAEKTTRGWLEHWIRNPKEFRPATKMPQFYDLSNQHDEVADNLTPIEVAGITQYLLDVSLPMETDSPGDYETDRLRGEQLFAQKGCLSCHSREADDSFGEISQDFGPDLSKMHLKIQPGQAGFDWMYTWLRNPNRYHPRTRMPILYLDPYDDQATGATIDPAAEIAAYLLGRNNGADAEAEDLDEDEDEETTPILGPEIYQPNEIDEDHLNELVKLHLAGRSLTGRQTDRLLGLDGTDASRDYPIARTDLRGDELELTLPGDAVPDEAEWRERKLAFVGKKTIRRYGCYACHSIPGFEDARPIGTAMQDWGRKDPHKLAIEHIEQYLAHHGSGGPVSEGHESTAKRVERAIKAARADEFENEAEAREELDIAYYYDQLLNHGRPGFLWQKLRKPRSFDYKKIETKAWDERLRMPKYTFSQNDRENDAAREAIATFVLGLVAEPPPEEYVYQPTTDEQSIIDGEQLLTKYNCAGCHTLELSEYKFVADLDPFYREADGRIERDAEGDPVENPESLLAGALSREELIARAENGEGEFHANALRMLFDRFKPAHPIDMNDTKTVTTPDGELTGTVVRFRGQQKLSQIEDPMYFATWETLAFEDELGNERIKLPNSSVEIPKAQLLGVTPGRGGEFADWLTRYLAGELKIKEGSAPQKVPPPLMLEGHKVQTPWLYQFLLEPYPIRRMAVLRMPKFNMSPEEARKLANYFAAKDGVPYPYQDLIPKEPEYLAERADIVQAESADAYLLDSWKILNGNNCIKCHSVGNRVRLDSSDPSEVIGPNLAHSPQRFRSDYLKLWLYQPNWILPYTGMSDPYQNDKPAQPTELLGGNPNYHTVALRDALLNYNALMEAHPKTVYEPKPAETGEEGAPADGSTGEKETITPPPTDVQNPTPGNPTEAVIPSDGSDGETDDGSEKKPPPTPTGDAIRDDTPEPEAESDSPSGDGTDSSGNTDSGNTEPEVSGTDVPEDFAAKPSDS